MFALLRKNPGLDIFFVKQVAKESTGNNENAKRIVFEFTKHHQALYNKTDCAGDQFRVILPKEVNRKQNL